LEAEAEAGHAASRPDCDLPTELPPPTPTSSEHLEAPPQIVRLVEEEEEEEEEAKQSTVTLMEEGEEDEEEEEQEERRRREAEEEKLKGEHRRRWRESQLYCPLSSSSSFSFSLSCMASLPELLHSWCSARLAHGRQRSLRRRQQQALQRALREERGSVATQAPPALLLPPAADSPSPTPVQEAPPLTESVVPEPDLSRQTSDRGTPSTEAHAATSTHAHTHPGAHIHPASPSATPEPHMALEPSRTAAIPPHSFTHASLSWPTPTQEEGRVDGDGAALDPAPLATLHRAFVTETQGASSAPFTPTPTLTPQPPASETAAQQDFSVAAVRTPPVQLLPTASRPIDAIPPPTELPHADTHGHGLDGGLQASRHSPAGGEQVDTPPPPPPPPSPSAQAGELQRAEDSPAEDPQRAMDSVDELLLGTNGNMQRSATEYYAELQGAGDYGNGAMLNGGAAHGSSQKESVFMRLNNRIKALEMNLSLSSRYLEELSQR